MTTINDIGDVVRIIEDNPDWRRELQRVLLTQELLEMPERVTSIDARLVALLESHEAALKRMDSMDTQIAELVKNSVEANKRMDSIDTQIAELVKNSVEANKRMDSMDTRLDDMDTKLNRIDGNVGDLKGHVANLSAVRFAPFISMEMGLQWQRRIEELEIARIWQDAQNAKLTGDISKRDRVSFWEADLVFEALDADDELCYIAVEVSYTADERETDRAKRNANYLTRFTGVPTYAVAASVNVDNRIRNILIEVDPRPYGQSEEEKVFWFKLPEPERPR